MFNSTDPIQFELAPDLRSNFERARILNDQLERGIESSATRIYAQLEERRVFEDNPLDPNDTINDLIRRAEENGIDTRALKTGLTLSL